MKNKIDYGKLCFVWMIGIISFLIFFSIIFVSFSANFSIKGNTDSYWMAAIWMLWNHFIPILGCIFSVMIPVGITYDEFCVTSVTEDENGE